MSDSQTTALRADNNPKFYSRFKWLGLAAFGFALYCVYDGYYTWPDEQLRGEAFMEMAQEELSDEQLIEAQQGGHGEKDTYQKIVKMLPKEEALADAWKAKAETNGWAAIPPAKLRGDGDIAGQYVMAGIAGLAGLLFLTTVFRSSGRWIELDGQEMKSSWGQSFTMDQVMTIDKRQWKDKGIARVKYTDNGRAKTFVVDDYKYHRKTTDEILRQIELRAGVDKITNGKPSPDPTTVEETLEVQPSVTEAADINS